jgi:hypothetical protein
MADGRLSRMGISYFVLSLSGGGSRGQRSSGGLEPGIRSTGVGRCMWAWQASGGWSCHGTTE